MVMRRLAPSVSIPQALTMTDILTHGPADADALLVLAHGAAAPMTSAFMETIVAALAARGVKTARFEFGYMAARRTGGKRRPPPRAESLIPEYIAAVELVRAGQTGTQPLLIGGKSMGGRVASHAADELHGKGLIAGLVCLGYPFHAANKPAALRTAHMETLRCPALIVQGERDPFGDRALIEGLPLSSTIALHWAGDGDHDLGPRGGKGYSRRGNIDAAADAIAGFAARLGTQ